MRILLLFLVLLGACTHNPSTQPDPAPIPQPIPAPEPNLKAVWASHPQGTQYSEIALEMIREHGPALLNKVPNDMVTQWCPSYASYTLEQKESFWVLLLSAMSRYESNFNTNLTFKEPFKDQTGQYVISRGLLQVSIESCRGYKTVLSNAQQLHDPAKNLECSVRILNRWLDRDGVIVGGSSSGWRGSSRYWAVLRTNHPSFPKVREEVRQRCL